MRMGKILPNIKGFTVIEVIIGMILTGLVVVFALSAIGYYNGFFFKMTESGRQQNEINLFQVALISDMMKAEKVLFNDGLVCQGTLSSVVYGFDNKNIVRTTEVSSDTFFIRHNTPVVESSLVSSELISQISIECFNDELLIIVSASKKYPFGLTFEKLK